MHAFRDLVSRARSWSLRSSEMSMDSLNFAIGIHEQLQVDIPETDWAQLHTLDEVVDHVAEKKAA